MNLQPLGLSLLFDAIFENGPMRLSVILPSMSIWQLSIIIEFSISPLFMITLFPMLVYGPMYAWLQILVFFPIMAGPLITAPFSTIEFSSMCTLP